VRARQSVDPDEQRLLSVIDACVARSFSGLRRSVQKNLAVATVAFLRVMGSARSGHGKLTLASLFRVLPTVGTPHAREKRLHRFLDNWRLDPRGVTDGLARLIIGHRGKGLWPIGFDQTQAGATQALVAGVPFEGRVLPLAVYTFQYPWMETAAMSQNQLEEVFLCDVETALPSSVRAVFIGDRGYARAALLRKSARLERLYIIRGRGGTQVEYQGRKLKLAELRVKTGRALRYRGVLYQARERVCIDVIVFHERRFKDPWYLLVPSNSEQLLPTKTVVALYRQRMRVEHSFRDFKTHLGLRGLKLKVRVAQRTGRLLLAFTIAYCLALVLGSSKISARARVELEQPRRKARHGTRRTLSVLSMAMQMLSHPRWRMKAYQCLYNIAARVAAGKPALRGPPPDIADRFRTVAA
jgi:hypothetical protein